MIKITVTSLDIKARRFTALVSKLDYGEAHNQMLAAQLSNGNSTHIYLSSLEETQRHDLVARVSYYKSSNHNY